MKILWTETALGHLSAIHKYISSTSTLYADRMIERVMDRGGSSQLFLSPATSWLKPILRTSVSFLNIHTGSSIGSAARLLKCSL